MHHTFLYISLPFLHECLISRFIENVTSNEEIFFPNLYIVPWNSGGFTYIWQSKLLGIIAIDTEGRLIYFLSDVPFSLLKWEIDYTIGLSGTMSFENPFELFSKSNLFRFPEGSQTGITLQYANLQLYANQTSLKVEARLANTLC